MRNDPFKPRVTRGRLIAASVIAALAVGFGLVFANDSRSFFLGMAGGTVAVAVIAWMADRRKRGSTSRREESF